MIIITLCSLLSLFQRIPYECFGGVEEIPVYDREKNAMKKVKRAKINNAYILVYQRSQEFNPEKWGKSLIALSITEW